MGIPADFSRLWGRPCLNRLGIAARQSLRLGCSHQHRLFWGLGSVCCWLDWEQLPSISQPSCLVTLYSETSKPRSPELSFPEWDLLPTIPPRQIFQEVGTSPPIPKVDKRLPRAGRSAYTLAVRRVIHCTACPQQVKGIKQYNFSNFTVRWKGVPKWASDHLVQLVSAFVGVKLLCLNKPANVCGPKNLDHLRQNSPRDEGNQEAG